jgi:hypothetical protein
VSGFPGLAAESFVKHWAGQNDAFVLPTGVTLRPQPLLTDADLLLYNLIRLAVEDHYLSFRGFRSGLLSASKQKDSSIASVETDRTEAT